MERGENGDSAVIIRGKMNKFKMFLVLLAMTLLVISCTTKSPNSKAEIMINLSSTNNGSVVGSTVILENHNGVSTNIYQRTAGSSTIVFEEIPYGTYTLIVNHTLYKMYIDDYLSVRSKNFEHSVLLVDFDSFVAGNSEQWNETISEIKSSGNDKSWTIHVLSDFSIQGDDQFTFGDVTGLEIKIKANQPKNISLSSNGHFLMINLDQSVEIEDINVIGIEGNNRSLVIVNGFFTMQSGSISGNILSGSNGAGVSVMRGNFYMYGGSIHRNGISYYPANSYGNGIGVYVSNG